MEGEFKNFIKSHKGSSKAVIPPPYNLSVIHPPFQPLHCPFLRHHLLLPRLASQFQTPSLLL
ncbi:hypothetical protein CRYUN_Cryun38cG0070800 [Craigia yunnanensis]